MSNVPLDELRKIAAALDILEKPGVHIQGMLAVDKNGNKVPPHFENACGFCALGAMEKTGVSWQTRLALAKHIRPVDYTQTEDPIWQTNDSPMGRPKIRQLMKDFVHAEMKDYGKDTTDGA